MGRLRVSDFVHLRSLAWNLRLACGAGRHGDWCDRSIGAGCSPAPAWFCGEQELCGLEPFRHFGPHRGREYRCARPAARSQFLRSCFNDSYDTAAAGAGSDILGADILDTALDCAVSGATSRQTNNALREIRCQRRDPNLANRMRHLRWPYQFPFFALAPTEALCREVSIVAISETVLVLAGGTAVLSILFGMRVAIGRASCRERV